jgi:hypothetical protein
MEMDQAAIPENRVSTLSRIPFRRMLYRPKKGFPVCSIPWDRERIVMLSADEMTNHAHTDQEPREQRKNSGQHC